MFSHYLSNSQCIVFVVSIAAGLPKGAYKLGLTDLGAIDATLASKTVLN